MGACCTSSNQKVTDLKTLESQKAKKRNKVKKEEKLERLPIDQSQSNGITSMLVAQLEEQRIQNQKMLEMIGLLKIQQDKTYNLLRQPKANKNTQRSFNSSKKTPTKEPKQKLDIPKSELSIESRIKGSRLSMKRPENQIEMQKFQQPKTSKIIIQNRRDLLGIQNSFTPPVRLESRPIQLIQGRNIRFSVQNLGNRGSSNTLGQPMSQIRIANNRLKTVKKSPRLLEQLNRSDKLSSVYPLLLDEIEHSENSSSSSSLDLDQNNSGFKSNQIQKRSTTMNRDLLHEYVDTVIEENEETANNDTEVVKRSVN